METFTVVYKCITLDLDDILDFFECMLRLEETDDVIKSYYSDWGEVTNNLIVSPFTEDSYPESYQL